MFSLSAVWCINVHVVFWWVSDQHNLPNFLYHEITYDRFATVKICVVSSGYPPKKDIMRREEQQS